MSAGFFERHGNVYVYVPNLIGATEVLSSLQDTQLLALTILLLGAGYARLLSAIGAFGLAMSSPAATVALYLVGYACCPQTLACAQSVQGCAALQLTLVPTQLRL